jgi:hypothetical protein
MSKRNRILTLVLLALPFSAALGQDNASASPQAGTAPAPEGSQQSGSVPTPAFGVDNQVAPMSENPPITALDQPGLEPHAAPLSYLQPALHLSEAADSNVTDTLGNSAIHSATRALGSLELQRLWSHYDLALDYVGGVGYYSASGIGFKNIEQFDIEQKITWKRGQLGIRDSFSYLPEGTFGVAYGAEGGLGETLIGGPPPSFLSGGILATLSQVPRIMNLSLVDVVQNLSPKSSFTAVVGYGFMHYTGDTQVQGISFLGSQQLSVLAGYNRVVGPHDQVAVEYGYQNFQFSVAGAAFHSNLAQLMWGHRISGRLEFIGGIGPQATTINAQGVDKVNLSVAGRASLRYKFPKTTVELLYERFNTSGSGLFAGAETDNARLSASRPLSRVWSVTTDLGYAHNRREVPLTNLQVETCLIVGSPTCVGVAANTFDYGFAGVALHRMLGRTVHVYASYQFNDLSFDPSYCGFSSTGASLSPCNRTSLRHIGTFGLDWTPRPIRLD